MWILWWIAVNAVSIYSIYSRVSAHEFETFGKALGALPCNPWSPQQQMDRTLPLTCAICGPVAPSDDVWTSHDALLLRLLACPTQKTSSHTASPTYQILCWISSEFLLAISDVTVRDEKRRRMRKKEIETRRLSDAYMLQPNGPRLSRKMQAHMPLFFQHFLRLCSLQTECPRQPAVLPHLLSKLCVRTIF